MYKKNMILLALIIAICSLFITADQPVFDFKNSKCTSDKPQSCSTQEKYNFVQPQNQNIGNLSSNCMGTYVIDLTDRITRKLDFDIIKYFIMDSVSSCFDITIGKITITTITENSDSSQGFYECDSIQTCSQMIGNLDYDKMVQNYNTDLVDNDEKLSSSYANNLTNIFKNSCPCQQLNSVVLLTNRIVNIKSDNMTDFDNICNYTCMSFSVILLGRNENNATNLLTEYYKNICPLTDVFNIPDYNCLSKIFTCILPCNAKCSENQYNNCTTYPIRRFSIIYILAFSTSISQENLTLTLENGLDSCCNITDFRINIVVSSTSMSTTYFSFQELKKFTRTIKITDTLIQNNTEESELSERILLAQQYNPLLAGVEAPTVFVLTDYFSKKLVTYYLDDSQPIRKYNFFLCVYDNYSYEMYQQNFIPSLFFGDYESKIPLLPSISKMSTFIQTPTSAASTTVTEEENVTHMSSTTLALDGTTASSTLKTTIIIIVICCSIGVGLFSIVGYLIYRKCKWTKEVRKIQDDHQVREENFDKWELKWDQLLIKSEQLGSGAYGEVLQGKLLEFQRFNNGKFYDDKNTDVAIKMPQRYSNNDAKQDFLREIKMMKEITGHQYIIKMIGCITIGQRICLVLEFCSFRDLLQYVQNKKRGVLNGLENVAHITKEYIIFAWQISQGMQYLASEGIIHRDLAARNILIDGHKNVKISDFGLCVQTADKLTNSPPKNVLILEAGKVPIKWLSIESLKSYEFSLKSDIWAFGMVLYEMYSFGEIPFAEVDAAILIKYLEAGNRPQKPQCCSEEMYTIMKKCWKSNPASRPAFDELITIFTVILENSTEGYGYLTLMKCEIKKDTLR